MSITARSFWDTVGWGLARDKYAGNKSHIVGGLLILPSQPGRAALNE